ncbi:MAG: FHA domain-containing protein [Phycisphaerae bacterium]
MDVRLIMFREDGSKRVFNVTEGVTTIGRKDESSIRIPLAVVSRRHARITLNEHRAVLKNLGASNGTYLNNKRIEEQTLEAGDQIIIGPVVFTVQIDGKPGDDELIKVRSKISAQQQAKGGAAVATSRHVAATNEELDPISALEALASSADQTAITPEEDI